MPGSGVVRVLVSAGMLAWAGGSFAAAGTAGGEVAADSREARQARTVADLRNLGTAILSWVTDRCCDDSPAAEGERLVWRSGPCEEGVSADEGAASAWVPPVEARIEYDDLVSLLRPSEELSYMDAIPEFDAWGLPYEVYLRRDDLLAERIVILRSAGADGVFDADCYTPAPFDPAADGNDIVWSDGFFVRWPQRPGAAPR